MYKKKIIYLAIALLLNFTLLTWIVMSIFKPSLVVADLYSKDFYTSIISKSNTVIDVVDDEYEDEDRRSLTTIFIKYLTGIDIENPESYMASQIPLLSYLDISNLVAEGDEPIVITPKEDDKAKTDDILKIVTDKTQQTQPAQNKDTEINVIKPNEQKVDKKKLDMSKPLVLIFHTHTTESYNPQNLANRNFTTDYNNNVTKVGEQIKKELEEKYGIATLHDITIHDLPTREKGYEKSRPTVSTYLKKYPSLKIIIDLHRDASVSVSKTTAIINNEKYARPMFVVGSKNTSYKTNAAKAQKISDLINSMYPGFSRGLLYKNAKYNQDLSKNMVLIEVGSNLNSLDEAIRTSKIIAKAVALYLK